MKDKITFVQEDAFKIIAKHAKNSTTAFFIDPPYTVGGKRAGSRLYVHNEINHAKLFDVMSRAKGSFLMTYDETQEVRDLVSTHGFKVARIPMKSTHHAVRHELLISRGE